ncbi:MAG: hypothetical protein DME97_12335 [Verrucomicrobia bacterium]|nr:MAG: hypothetical protein DME97_12335 [Verrucomicrobiota bacterium]
MMHRACRGITILVSLLGLATGSCSKPTTQDRANPPPPSTTPAAPTADTGADACTLLTKEEIRAVQGEAFKDTKLSQKTGAGLAVSQCYFELPTAVNSIVLTVTRKAEGGADPGQSWQDMFHRERAPRKKEEVEEKEAQKIDGLGEEAFWTGTRVGGALFVLKGNCYIRISVGGAGDQAQKIEKSKALAENVLKRL